MNKNLAIGLFGGTAILATGIILYKSWKQIPPNSKRKDEGEDSQKISTQIKNWEKQFLLTEEQLLQMIQHFEVDMEHGLRGEKSTMKMIPSFVEMPTGLEKGTFYALDLGGTNFRVLRQPLLGNGNFGNQTKEEFKIPTELMTGSGEQLFDFIAKSVRDFVLREEKETESTNVIIGFTFSFPVNQTAINRGTLIQWTKGFTTKGVEGKDVVEMLKEAFIRVEKEQVEKKKFEFEVRALVNDTVGTLVARAYQSNKEKTNKINLCPIGLILGTGTNAAYLEDINRIVKLKEKNTKSSSMIVNMEWGGFGDFTNFLPLSNADSVIDKSSNNIGRQRFEKMISGMYLGEIMRIILNDVITATNNQFLFRSFKNKTKEQLKEALQTKNSFQTAFISKILSTSNNSNVDPVIKEWCSLTELDVEEKFCDFDFSFVYSVANFVMRRAARLSAAFVASLLQQNLINQLKKNEKNLIDKFIVAVDGSVFELIPGFKEEMYQYVIHLLNNLLKKKNFPSKIPEVELILTRDGSGIGAAVIAATHS